MRRLALPLLLLIACKSSNAPSAPTTDDDGPFDPKTADGIQALFQQVVDSRPPTPAQRAVFLKPHGCASAKVDIPDLPANLKVGLFAAPASHSAWVRMSSDTTPTTTDLNNNTIGFAVKVLGVADGPTQDFLFQNINVFFTDTAADFLAFETAAFAGKDKDWLATHPRTQEILTAMEKPVENVLGSRYWSTTTYRFGTGNYVKYSVTPCVAPAPEAIPAAGTPDADNYLRKRLERDLGAADACFNLQVQLRQPGWPLDAATVEWDETKSPPQTVAKITIPKQDITQNDATCENMAFTAWHALPAHQPVGSINKARQIVYQNLGNERRTRNNVPLTEPTQ